MFRWIELVYFSARKQVWGLWCAYAALTAAKAQPLFKVRPDLGRTAAWFARVVRPVQGATTGAPGGSGLLGKFLVYAYKDLKKLDVLKQGMAHWNRLSVVVNKRLPQN